MSEMLALQFGKQLRDAANIAGANLPRFTTSGDQANFASPKTLAAKDNDAHTFFAESQELTGVLPS